MDDVSISWVPCMGATLVDVPLATSLTSWVSSLPMMDAQFQHLASGSFPTLTLLGWECFVLFGLVSGSRLCFFTTTFGLGWKDQLAKGVAMVCLHLVNCTIFFFNDG